MKSLLITILSTMLIVISQSVVKADMMKEYHIQLRALQSMSYDLVIAEMFAGTVDVNIYTYNIFKTKFNETIKTSSLDSILDVCNKRINEIWRLRQRSTTYMQPKIYKLKELARSEKNDNQNMFLFAERLHSRLLNSNLINRPNTYSIQIK